MTPIEIGAAATTAAEFPSRHKLQSLRDSGFLEPLRDRQHVIRKLANSADRSKQLLLSMGGAYERYCSGEQRVYALRNNWSEPATR